MGALIGVLPSLAVTGCTTETAIIGGAVVGTTIIGGTAPAQEIEQVYYLGVIDPQEQVPPTVYRVTVRGQASAISAMQFGSGWVHASLIDSLNTRLEHDPKTGRVSVAKSEGETLAAIQANRRLVLFGPEGFREAPKDHRLVIVMGASPENFFNAIDRSLGIVAQGLAEQSGNQVSQELFQELVRIESERDRLDDVARALPAAPK
jgi:archaeosine-15-forming tRNA-guanine transglycosylase